MTRSAIISECQRYRYRLWRSWSIAKPYVCFVMLNPSTADHEIDDPTIRRCMGFAESWGYGGVEVVNLFAYRATHPRALRTAVNPIGDRNDAYILDAAARSHLVIAAWGTCPIAKERSAEVLKILRLAPNGLQCLGKTANGSPRHPLYVRANVQPMVYK